MLARRQFPCPPASTGVVSTLVLLLALLAPGCDPEQSGVAGLLLGGLEVNEVGPVPLIAGSRLTIRGAGFAPPEVADVIVVLRGDVGDRHVEIAVRPQRDSSEQIAITLVGEVADAMLGSQPGALPPGSVFIGDLLVQRTPVGEAPYKEVGVKVELPLSGALQPQLVSLTPSELHPGETIRLAGDGFLHPSEGISLVTFEGHFTTIAPVTELDVAGLYLPAAPPDPLRRDVLEVELTPDVFGVLPGTFDGTVRVENSALDGAVTASADLSIDGTKLAAPRIDEVRPTAAARGQLVEFHGLGLLPADGLLQAGVLVVLDGLFTPHRGPAQQWSGVHAQALFPDEQVDHTVAGVVLRVTRDLDGQPVGIAKTPGVFEGTVAPLVFSGADSVSGEALPLTFEILSPRQWVYLKFLPAFDDALEAFGLLAERDAVIARILQVNRRDYEGVNVFFATEPPDDFVEYSIVEVGGEDPNGSSLLGLDNTAGKDVGNVRFDDVIGGFNAETRARGFAAYGGIFAAELLNLSPTLADSALASSRFDDIFAATVPSLGGVSAAAGESEGDDARGQAIRTAAHTLGNLVGNTITHEVGHTLGLSALQGQFHNVGDEGPYIMDSGIHRSFEERAELDGYGPGVFSPFNRDYLADILPVDGARR